MTNNLSPAAKKLLGLLEFRRGDGQCYLVDRPRARTALYVPTWLPSHRPEPVAAFNDRTVRELTRAGLVTVDEDSLPQDEQPELLRKMIRCYEDCPGKFAVWKIALVDETEAAEHVHTDGCMCHMVPMGVEGARECHYCGGHTGGPCGDRCDIARAEVTARG